MNYIWYYSSSMLHLMNKTGEEVKKNSKVAGVSASLVFNFVFFLTHEYIHNFSYEL